ncbi:MAG: cadherin-like beta sandwich domain-containing protein [Fibrobacteria bacterium]
MRKLITAAAFLAISVFWACHLNEADSKDHFDLKVDSSWAKCDSLMVLLMDTNGHVLDTLFNDTLKSLDQFKDLDATKYRGGTAIVRITGTKAGGLCIDQSRTFDDKGAQVVVDTFSIPGSPPKSVSVTPSSLNLKAGDTGVAVQATITPLFADQMFEWSVDDASVATLELPNGSNAGRAMVVPLKNGTTRIKVKAKQDGSISAGIVVQVGPVGGRSVSIVPDSLDLFLGGPDSVLRTVTAPESIKDPISWSSNDESIVKVDDGKVHALKTGMVTIKATFGEATATAQVRVKRDIPVLTVASKTGATVNSPITFSPKATQAFGSIIMFKWDLDGDGNYDDSLPGPFLGTSVDLPPATASYSKEGQVKPKFLVRDGEGNEAVTEVSLDIGNQPPEVLSKSADTLISINDVLTLEARVRDAEGKVAVVGFDYDGDGKLDDSVKVNDSVATLKTTHGFVKVGKQVIILIATDDAGKTSSDSVRVGVLLDPPVADIGPDISIIAGSPVAFTIKGTDKFGPITKREIKVGSGSYLNLGKQDTSIIVPGDSGKVEVIGRVTDDDGNSDEDTMAVTLLPPSKSNNDLSSLVPSAGSLTPGFKPVTVAYSLQVGYNDSNVAMTALTTDPKVTLVINGVPAVSGKISDSVSVKVGTTQKAFEIVVTAQDGNQKTYTVSITRAPSADASLAKLEPAKFSLKPAFASNVLNYADTVAFATASVTVKPTASHPAAKIVVNDSVVATGTASKALPLIVGDNLITIVVTAQDGKTKSMYAVKVVRRAKVILSRLLAGNTVQTDSLEAPLGATITAKIADSTGFHFTKWSITEGTGNFLDSASGNTKLTVKAATVRATGSFAINVYTIRTGFNGFAGGKFTPDSARVNHGTDTTITLTPLTGYRILALTDNGKPASTLGASNGLGARTYKVAGVTGNHHLEASFQRIYTLTTSATGSGTISPLGTTTVDSGATQVFDMASGSPSTGVIVSSLVDNEKNQIGDVTGDPMNASKYTLAGINADHVINAVFTVKTFTLRATGVNLCIRNADCIGIKCLILKCVDGTNADTLTVQYNSRWNISTDSVNTLGGKFVRWNKDGTAFSTERGMTSDPVLADVVYSASYSKIIIIDPCPIRGCIIIDPPILVPAGSNSFPTGENKAALHQD